jgi:cytochrome oxidase Cu insertion factor (SCO1/SenC/PrrC family)
LGTLISLRRLSLLAALFLTVAAARPPHVTRPAVGQQASAFTLRDQNGKRVSLAEAVGTKVVLVFYRGYW